MSAAFNQQLRAAAGRGPSREPGRSPVGSIGVGRGGGAQPRGAPGPGMTALIRAAVDLRRERLYDRADFYSDIHQEAR